MEGCSWTGSAQQEAEQAPHSPVIQAAGLTLDQEPWVGPGDQRPAAGSWALLSAIFADGWELSGAGR